MIPVVLTEKFPRLSPEDPTLENSNYFDLYSVLNNSQVMICTKRNQTSLV